MRGRRALTTVDVPGGAALSITCAVAALVLGMATVAGAVRVLPWIVAPDVPLRVALPFARALLGVGLETALLSAPPVGWALAFAKLVERGEARAFFAVGVSPWGVVRRTVPHLAGCAVLAAAAALAWGAEAAAPGRMVRAMVDQSRVACAHATSPRVLHVPFVGATWLCAAPSAPRIFGSLPGGGGQFTAADLRISDDLRAVELVDSRILLGTAAVRLHVAETTVRGLVPWGRASNLGAAARSLLVAATGAGLALAAAWLLVQRVSGGRLVALLIGISGPIAALATLTRLEAAEHRPLVYFAVPLAGLAALFAAHGLAGIAGLARLARVARLARRAPRARRTAG
jgi:hypothetical protein